MNSGTQAAKEAGNMVDLDSDPTKLIEVVEIGKQPDDMVTASASGLDPGITIQNAEYQLDRVASKWAADLKRDPTQIRNEIGNIVRTHAYAPMNGLFGEEMVNVLQLNLELHNRYGAPQA